jgi:hypothetical protein
MRREPKSLGATPPAVDAARGHYFLFRPTVATATPLLAKQLAETARRSRREHKPLTAMS